MKTIRKYLYSIDHWFYWYFPIYFDFEIFFILSEWLSCRKIFKFPHITIYSGSDVFSTRESNIFSVEVNRLGWKWKFDDICFEHEPEIRICFLNCYGIKILFESPSLDIHGYRDNNGYWEFMLNYLYKYKQIFVKAYNDWGWTHCNFIEDNGEKYVIDVPSWDWNMFTSYTVKKYLLLCKKKKIDFHKMKL